MRFRPLFALGVGAMVIAVPSDRGTSRESEDSMNSGSARAECSLAVPRTLACCSRGRPRLIWASRCEWSFSSHMRKYWQPTGEGGSR